MTNRELERRLQAALSHTAPNDVEDVLSHCKARKGNVMTITAKKNRPLWRGLIAACLAVTLLAGAGALFYQQSQAVASVVSIDVNPSIELKVNKKNVILTCTPLNEEAHTLLADMSDGNDLKGAKLKVGVNAIVGSLVRHGYLDSISSAILVSVEDRNATRAEWLQQELAGVVDVLLAEQSVQATVLSQTVTQEPQLETLTRENNLSIGKAHLIRQVMETDSTMATNDDTVLKQLSSLSVEELYDLLATKETRIPIGKEAAEAAVRAYAGVSDRVTAEVDAELDEIPAHYEVELHTAAGEWEYIVDAFTGEVLSGQKDGGSPNDALPPPASTPPASTPPTSTPPASTPPASTPPSSTPPASTPPTSAVPNDIGAAQAKAIALTHAGLTEAQVSRLKVERDFDDGRLTYDIEFCISGMEYDYTIDAASGKILEYDKEADN